MSQENQAVSIKVLKGAPYLVKGPITLIHTDGREEVMESAHLCRCGASGKKPFCDGTHAKIGFEKE
ncbi:MAG: CDGSH iron-sulfur domain-containing protein [Bacteroidales bacterium]|jgi:CDGSH-type Zn-finger protein|nr:CDGSH iron-sulfur domain-containing protein [Bacteroidales bacterium]MDD3166201.1 CDGSH iron-sulfur domain-containing protein [Bacteroidales bacterium]MDD4770363.1 CDGSH iron-sulfur domain-containing protein [Bacteroidales bacterium]HKL93640.1 CDGSH iron-sulfur domain-containing protein [Bacteroidales bacterium]